MNKVRLSSGAKRKLEPAEAAFWKRVEACDDFKRVLKVAATDRNTYGRRLAEFIQSQALPLNVPVDEVERWRGVVERCAKKSKRDALGVYRCVIAARLASL